MVEYASTRLISVWVQAMMAARKAEMAPTQVINCSTETSNRYIGYNRATRYTPATTMVAACINADTGVGPSMASGNQICKGNMADLPAPPINTNTSAHLNTGIPTTPYPVICAKTGELGPVIRCIMVPKSSVPL